MKWRCVICNYIHTGDNPPDVCPVCGATKDQFVLVEENVIEDNKNKKLEPIYTDIVIIGTGGASLTAGITAIDEDLEVEILEKSEAIGGTSARSGGRIWIPNSRAQKEAGIEDNRDDGIKYMARYAFPNKFNRDKENYGIGKSSLKLIETYYDTGSEVLDYFSELGVMDFEIETNWRGTGQLDYMDLIPYNRSIRGRTIRPKTEKGAGITGFDYIQLMNDWLKNRGVEVKLNHRVYKILKNDDNRVIGVRVETPEGDRDFFGRKGVIFGTGGFSHNRELMERFQYGPSFGGCAFHYNEGDLVNMAEEIGLKLGNMANAYRNQSLVEQVIDNPGGVNALFYITGDSVIQVNRFGKRVMNEKRNYNDRARVHFQWDPVSGQWTNEFLFLVMDERTANNWQGMIPLTMEDNIDDIPYIIKGDNPEELGKNISNRLDKIKKYIGEFSLDESFSNNLEATIARFNGFAETGVDEDFNRGLSEFDNEFFTFPPLSPRGIEWPPKNSKNPSMYPLDTKGPLYAFILGAGTLDTNGGPIIDTNGQMIDYRNRKVEGLYGAGNCVASPSMGAYWGAGATLGSAMIFSYRAVKDLVNKEDTKF